MDNDEQARRTPLNDGMTDNAMPLDCSRIASSDADSGRLRDSEAMITNQIGSHVHDLILRSSIGLEDTSRLHRELSMGGGKTLPPDLMDREMYVVDFDGPDDSSHPMNWSPYLKARLIAILSFTTFITTFASGIYSPAISTISQRYNVGHETATLGITLYVLGFSAGPVLWGPLSEAKGRRLPLVVGAFGTAIFQFAVAVSKDMQSILINRFFAGFFGAAPLAVGGGVFADLYDSNERGIAVTIFTISVFIGPLFSPFIGEFIVHSHLGWRWTQYVSGILASAAAGLNVVFLYETYAPIILAKKANKLRKQTKNWAIHARHEETYVDVRELVEKTLVRPLHMLLVEPIVLLFSLYSAFIYGLLYLFFTAYPRIFQGVYHMRPGVSGLPELGAVVGAIAAGGIMLLRQSTFVRRLKANGNVSIPEWRMIEAMPGAVLLAGGLFWMGWSGCRDEVHWIVPLVGGGITGLGIALVFLQSFNYLIDSYMMYAASAVSANTFLRSLFGAIFPLFATYMFDKLGVEWSLTLLGCFASVLAPVPIIFYFYGARIRQISKYNPQVVQGKPAQASTPEREGEV